jgi:hypothetical protein
MKFAYFNPTVMAVDDVPSGDYSQLKALTDAAHEHGEKNDEGNPEISIRGGQQIQLLPNELGLDTTHLKDFVENRCKEYIANIIKTSGVGDLYGYDPVLISAWTIKQESGDYQALHSHEAHISGNIYIDVPLLEENARPSDANIEFRLPVIRNPAHFVFTDQWRFKPQPLKMIIFPSYIPHTVYPWSGQGCRTILAWDAKLIAK